jgi:hypothetical protein
MTTDAVPTPSPALPEPSLPPPPPPPATPPPAPAITLLRVVGSVVAALVVAGTTVSVVSRFFHQHRVETAVYTQPLNAMSIRTTTGDLRVAVGAPGSPVVVRRVLDWSFGAAGSTETVSDGRLDIAAHCSIRLGVGSCDVDYEVTVPPNLAVRLDSNTGDVDVTGAVGDVTAISKTGDVRIQGARSQLIEAATSTGDVSVELLSAPVDVEATTTTGEVRLILPADGTSYDVVGTSTSDIVTVPTSPDADRRVNASSSTGDVVVLAAS